MVGATGIEPVTPTMSMCKSFGSASNNYEISYCKNWIFRDRHFVDILMVCGRSVVKVLGRQFFKSFNLLK